MNRLPHKLREQADFEEAESTFGSGSYTRELMREAADALDNATKDVAFYMRLAGAFQCEAELYRWIKRYVEKRPLRFQGDGFFADVHSAEALDTFITNSIDLERTVQ